MTSQAQRKLSAAVGESPAAWSHHRTQSIISNASGRSVREPSYDGLTLTLPRHSINEAENHYPRWQLHDTRTSSLASSASEGPRLSGSAFLGLPPTLITVASNGTTSSSMSMPPVMDDYYSRSGGSSVHSQEYTASVAVPHAKHSLVHNSHGGIAAGGLPRDAIPAAKASISTTAQRTDAAHAKHSLVAGDAPVPSPKSSIKVAASPKSSITLPDAAAPLPTPRTPAATAGLIRAKLMSEPGQALASAIAKAAAATHTPRAMSVSVAGAPTGGGRTLDKDFTFSLERTAPAAAPDNKLFTSKVSKELSIGGGDVKPAEPQTPEQRPQSLSTTSHSSAMHLTIPPALKEAQSVVDEPARGSSVFSTASTAVARSQQLSDGGVKHMPAGSRADTLTSTGQQSLISQAGYDASDEESRQSVAWSGSTQGAAPAIIELAHQRSKSIGHEELASVAALRSRVRTEFRKQGLNAFDKLERVEDKASSTAAVNTSNLMTALAMDSLGSAHTANWATASSRESMADPLADLAALEEDLALVMKRLPASLRYGAREGGSELVTTGLVQQLYSRLARLQAMLRRKESEFQAVQKKALELQFKLTTSEAYQAGLDKQLQEATKKLEERDQEVLELSKQAREAERHVIEVASGASRKSSTTGAHQSGSVSDATEAVAALRDALGAAQAALEQRDEQLSAANSRLAERDRELREAEYVLRASEREMASQLTTAARRLLMMDKGGSARGEQSASESSVDNQELDNSYRAYIKELELEVQNLKAALSVASPRHAPTRESPRVSQHTPVQGVTAIKARLSEALAKSETTGVQTTGSSPRVSMEAGSLMSHTLNLELTEMRSELMRQQHSLEAMQQEAAAALQTAERERESQQRLQVMVHKLHEEAARAMNEANRLAGELQKAKTQGVSQQRVESHELSLRLEHSRTELEAVRQQLTRQQAANSTEIMELRHRIEQLQNQLRDAQNNLSSAELMLQKASEDAKVWRTRYEATSERLSGEVDTSCRLKLQLSVYQGSIAVLEKALAESRDDLVEARQKQLEDELSILELRNKVEEASRNAEGQLAYEWELTDRLARLHLERLMELRHERFFLSLTSPQAVQPTSDETTTLDIATRSSAAASGTAAALAAHSGGAMTDPVLEALRPLPGVAPADLSESVEWHSGLEVLERHLQLGSSSDASVIRPRGSEVQPVAYLTADGLTSLQSSRLTSLAGTDTGSVHPEMSEELSRGTTRRSTLESKQTDVPVAEHVEMDLTLHGLLSAAEAEQQRVMMSSAAGRVSVLAAQRHTGSLSGSVSFASEAPEVEAVEVGSELQGDVRCGSSATHDTSIVQLVRRTLEGEDA